MAEHLIISDMDLAFGGIQALARLSCEVRRKEIVAIIGPNGSGKTCLINCITGFYRPQNGNICFEGESIVRRRPDKIVRLGIVRTFQHDELFSELSTLENLLMARHMYMKCGVVRAGLYFKWTKRDEIENRKAVDQTIAFLELASVRNEIVGSLPYGMQKKIGLARALVMQPKLLFLDEPMAGLSLAEKEEMVGFIRAINRLGMTIVLVEHDMNVVMGLAHRIVVLHFGQKIAEGPPEDVTHDPKVIEAYLGENLNV